MTASAFACDVSKVAQIKNLVADTVKQFGCIDVLINSAGVVRRKYAVEYTEEDWDFIMDINLKGAYFCSVEVGKQMIQQRCYCQPGIAPESYQYKTQFYLRMQQGRNPEFYQRSCQ